MLRLAALLLSLTLQVHAGPIQPLIVGGRDAAVGEFPFIVSIQARRGGHYCGGSLISPNWILTASHCMKGAGRSKVVVGLHDQTRKRGSESFAIKQVVMHPQYNEDTMDYDFALIEIQGQSKFTPVEINDDEIQIPQLPGQILATVAGWGDLTAITPARSPDILQKVDIPLVPKSVCAKAYRDLTDRMICAGFPQGGKDSCQGDSGGPLVTTDPAGRMKLVGVVSWGEGCARPNFPGVYAKVNSVIDWIDVTIQ